MLLSVLIPAYNNSLTILRCINSVLNQDYSDDYEIIVSDDASTDNTVEVIKTINDKRIRVVENASNTSAPANHNKLLRLAQSDYVVFLHGDDELMPEALKIISYHLRERLYPQRYILWGHSNYGDVSEWASELQHPMLGYNTMFSGVTAKRVMLYGAAPQPTGTCYSRKAILEIGGFEERQHFTMWDWLLAEKAAYNYFEFEMCDRLLLKREYSSVDAFLTEEERKRNTKISQQILWESLSELQQKDLKALWEQYGFWRWNDFFIPPPTKEDKLTECRKKISNHPLRIRLWIKYLLLYFDLK